jgi:hypothetical protein
VAFLSVAGRFHVVLACDIDNEQRRKWAGLAMELLKEALANWGVGGKTSSGYGRLVDADAQPRLPSQNFASATAPTPGDLPKRAGILSRPPE